MRLLLIAFMILAMAGCGKTTTRERTQKASKAKEVTAETVKTMSGYNDIQIERRTKDRIRQISAERQQDLNEVAPEGE